MDTICNRNRSACFPAWGTRGIVGALLLGVLALVACTPGGESGTAAPPTLRPPTATPGASLSPEPLEPSSDPFAASRAALEAYEPPHGWEGVSGAVESDVARWLAEGNDPAGLAALLRTLPKLDADAVPEVAVIDLNGDGLQDVVVQTQLMGLPVIVCLAQEGSGFAGQLLPPGFDEPLPTMVSGFLASDLTGDGRPEILVNYTVQGGSGWTELLYAYEWRELFTPALVFHASLLNWAGASSWALEPGAGQPGRQQIVLVYPYLYGQGFDHKMVNHPLVQEVWRWDADAGSFVFSGRTVDLERSGWGPEAPPITLEDRLRWLTNEGEQAFRSGAYGAAADRYGQVLALATAQGWAAAGDQPDWAGLARFRRGEALALQRRAAEALVEMQAVADDYAGDVLGELAAGFLAGYGDGSAPDGAARGVAAMQDVDLYAHFYNEQGGALRFPMDAAGILYPGAGLAAYLDAHPELVGDRETLWGGLQQVGFAAGQVWLKNAGDEEVVNGDVLIALELSGAPTGEWALARSGGRWQVVPPTAAAESGPVWPSVGGFTDPVRRQSLPQIVESHLSPDGQWRAEVEAYECVQDGEADEGRRVEQLRLIRVADGEQTTVDSQQLSCGSGLGAYGLGGWFWSPGSRYFYYTDAREGVPDGGGSFCWNRPLIRLDVIDGSASRLGKIWDLSPEGTTVAMGREGDLVLWDLDEGEIARTPVFFPEAEVCDIAWSPDGRALAYLQTPCPFCFPGEFYVVSFDVRESRHSMLLKLEEIGFVGIEWETAGQMGLSGYKEGGEEWASDLPVW